MTLNAKGICKGCGQEKWLRGVARGLCDACYRVAVQDENINTRKRPNPRWCRECPESKDPGWTFRKCVASDGGCLMVVPIFSTYAKGRGACNYTWHKSKIEPAYVMPYRVALRRRG